jgi:AcrR family transcriptional regulator
VDGRRARGDATRARILREALQIASRQGLDGVTFGQVAEAAGVSKGHLAQAFGGREALQLATLDAAVELFSERVLNPANAEPTALERLRHVCLGWFDYVEGRVLPGGCLITAANSEFRTIAGPVRDRLIAFRQRRRNYLRATIQAVLEERPSRSPVDVDDLVYRILGDEAAANVALFLEDRAAFEHARRSTEALLATFDSDPKASTKPR